MRAYHVRTVSVAAVAGALLLTAAFGTSGRAGAQWLSSAITAAPPRHASPLPLAFAVPVDPMVSRFLPEASSPVPSPRDGCDPRVAERLAILPGVGHIYADELGRGMVLGAVTIGGGILAYFSNSSPVRWSSAVVAVAAYAYSIADAGPAARRCARRHPRWITATQPHS